MRRFATRLAAAHLVVALLAPVVGAGGVLADDLKDMAAGDTGLADNLDTPGPDLYAPLSWGSDIPDMPSLLDLDAPVDASPVEAPRAIAWVPAAEHDLAPCAPAPRLAGIRGPPAPLA